MVKYRNSIYFFSGIVFLYILVKHAGIRYSLPGFIAYHLTDLLFIPLQLFVCLWGLRILKRDKKLLIPFHLNMLVVLSMSVLFEWYLPLRGRGTGDLTDVWMYFIGGAIFHFSQRVL